MLIVTGFRQSVGGCEWTGFLVVLVQPLRETEEPEATSQELSKLPCMCVQQLD